MPILTPAQIRQANIPGLGSSTSEDTTLATFAARVDALIADWLGFPPASAGGMATILSATYTEYYDSPDDPYILRLGFWPVTSITSIYDDPLRAYGSDTLVASADYSLDGRRGLVILGTSSTKGRWYKDQMRAIKATFVAGFATVPTPIEAAALRVLARLWRGRSSAGLQSTSKAGHSASFRAESVIDEDDRRMLAPYQLVRAVI